MPDDELIERETESEAEGVETPKGKRKWIVIAAATALLLVVGMVGIWATGLLDPAGVEAETKADPAKTPPPEVTEVVSLDPVVVNLVGNGKMSYARIAVALGIHNSSPGSEVFRKEVMVPKLKDELLTAVGQMTVADLLKPEAKDQLKARIKGFVNGLLEKDSGTVVEVYFTDFIVQ